MSNYAIPFIGLTFLLIFSCSKDDSASVISSEDEAILIHIDSLAFDVSESESGLFSYPISLNPLGKTQQQGNVLTIFYQLSVLGGQVIEVYDSLDSDSIVVKQGANAIYPIGIDEGLGLMKEGEKWGFILPSGLAFGSFSFSTLIPENATILAEIELVEIRSEEDVLNEDLDEIAEYVVREQLRDTVANPVNQPQTLANGMVVKRIRASNDNTPTPGQLTRVGFTVSFLNGQVFDQVPTANPFEFYFAETPLIPGMEIALDQMQFGERWLALVPSYLGYRESAQVIPTFLIDEMVSEEIVPAYATKVPPYKSLVIEIDLIPAE